MNIDNIMKKHEKIIEDANFFHKRGIKYFAWNIVDIVAGDMALGAAYYFATLANNKPPRFYVNKDSVFFVVLEDGRKISFDFLINFLYQHDSSEIISQYYEGVVLEFS